MKKLLAVIVTVVLALSLFTSCAEGSKAFTSAYLNLGEKYLTDLDYEKAIVCFNKAIEVEPKNERAYLGAAEAYVALGDIDSAIAILEKGIASVDDPIELQAMLSELLGESETETETEDEVVTDDVVTDDTVPEVEPEEIHEFTAEEIGAAINEASIFAWNWFWDNQHTDKNDTITGPYGNGYYRYERVSEEGITTVNDVLKLTKQYFTEDVAEHMVGLKEWIEQDGVLYVSGTEGLGGDFPSYYEIYVQKTSDTSYDVTLYECYGEDEKYQSKFTYSYVDGYWVFDTLLTCDHEIQVYVLTELNSSNDGNDNIAGVTEEAVCYLETLSAVDSDKYTGNMGDSFIGLLGTRNSVVGISGTTYEHGLEAWIARWNYRSEESWAWCEYSIEGNYETLLGSIDVADDSYNTGNYNLTIQIIGDGELLWQTVLTQSTQYPVDVSVDVTGTDILRIYLYDNEAVSGGTAFILGDFRVVNGSAL